MIYFFENNTSKFALKIEKKYDIWISFTKSIYNIINLFIKGINELIIEEVYSSNYFSILYNKEIGKKYDINSYAQDIDIENGS